MEVEGNKAVPVNTKNVGVQCPDWEELAERRWGRRTNKRLNVPLENERAVFEFDNEFEPNARDTVLQYTETMEEAQSEQPKEAEMSEGTQSEQRKEAELWKELKIDRAEFGRRVCLACRSPACKALGERCSGCKQEGHLGRACSGKIHVSCRSCGYKGHVQFERRDWLLMMARNDISKRELEAISSRTQFIDKLAMRLLSK